MRYLAVDEQGQMQLAQTSAPTPGDGEVIIDVRASGINRADLLQRDGHYPPPDGESPVLGLEVAGVIAQTGAGVEQWQPGDKVCALVPGGGYAQKVAVQAAHLMVLPSNMGWAEGAALMEVYMTAYQALFWLGHLEQGQRVLIHAGASGVGSAAIQLATNAGAAVAVTASTDEKRAFARQLGATLTINYQQQDFTDIIKQSWGGVDLVLDVVAGDYVNRNLKVLNEDGYMVTLAILGGRFAERLDMARLLQKRATLVGSTLRNRSDDYKARLVAALTRDVLPLMETGKVQACVDQIYEPARVNEAHQKMANNHNLGKLVISWS